VKWLRNPWVVGGLCVVAFALAFYQGVRGHLRGVSARVSTVATASPEKKPSASVESLTNKDSEPGDVVIDQNYAQAHMPEWLEAPRRDPFLLAGQTSNQTGGTNASPVSLWKLKAIWRQTGGRVAAINERIYEEGDTIQGYRIERIEGDEVWLAGPRGPERLGFNKPQTGAHGNPLEVNATNQPAGPATRNPLNQ